MNVIQQDWAAKWALYSPDKIALKEYETGREWQYGELNTRATHIAQFLYNHYAINKGDRVAVLAEYSLEYVALFCASQKLGFIIVPLNYRLSPTEIAYLLKDAEPKLIFCEEKYEQLLLHTEGGVSMEKLGIIAQGFDNQINTVLENVVLNEDDPAFILYTSGTTGFPKGAIYSHKMLFWNSINTAMSLIVNQESRTLNVMPPFHTGGWNVLLTPFLHHGGYTCLLKKFEPAAVLQLLQDEKCTIFMGVPTMLKMIADLPAFEQATFPYLHYIIVGGEPMPIPLIEKWQTKGVMIRQGYGMTEVGPNLTSLHQDDAVRKKGSIGRPNFYVETKIVDENGQKSQNGELLLRGPMVTPGYWRNEEATQNSLKNGWFYTGDRVRQDEEGYLYVVDRIKNMYISGGENIYPAEIERVILTHPSVSEAAVIGVADEKWGEVGKAFIVTKQNTPVSGEDIIGFLQEQLAKFKIPKYITFLAALPKSDTGKINKKQLKEST